MVIQHNMMAFNANRQYGINVGKGRKLTEKLSSGYKINRAADDAAGLAISEKMRRMIRGLGQSAENIQDGIGFVQTADGALNEAHDMLQRMNELAVKSANGTNTEEDRQYIDSEIQQLKTELDRIFSTTTFNDKKIWDPNNGGRKKVGEELKQAVTFTMPRNEIDITNENCGVIGWNGYQMKADKDGVWVEWTGYDTNKYVTSKVDWATLKKNDYAFEMSDYFNNPENVDPSDSNKKINNALFDNGDPDTGNPLFEKKISFSVQETATVEDMIAAINGVGLNTYNFTPMQSEIKWTDGTSPQYYVRTGSSINVGAAYVSNLNSPQGYDFDNVDNDGFIEPANGSGTVLPVGSATGNMTNIPSATDVASAKANDEQWEMTFDMEGIGKVTAKSIYINYGLNLVGNYDSATKGLWWDVDAYGNKYEKSYIVYDPAYDASGNYVGSKATLGHAMEALTGPRDDKYGVNNIATPGMLSDANGGCGVSGGWMEFTFQIKAQDKLPFGDKKNDVVGSYTVEIPIYANDTEADVLNRMQEVFNSKTVLDLQRNKSNSQYPDSQEFYSPTAFTRQIPVPIWGGTNQFFVQAGTEGGQHISVDYECLSVAAMKMQHTNVLTVEDSENAINEIKNAIQMVSTQRSDFGAYQNRLEHAVNANENTEENTQAAESVIRDTDMAKTMVAYSNNNILLQAGQAMLAQANQNNQAILSLLQ